MIKYCLSITIITCSFLSSSYAETMSDEEILSSLRESVPGRAEVREISSECRSKTIAAGFKCNPRFSKFDVKNCLEAINAMVDSCGIDICKAIDDPKLPGTIYDLRNIFCTPNPPNNYYNKEICSEVSSDIFAYCHEKDIDLKNLY